MTLVRTSQFVRLELTSMKPPSFPPLLTAVSRQSNIDPQAESVVLFPDIPSRMLVKITNTSNEVLDLNLAIEGDFPTSWCQIETDRLSLQPGQSNQFMIFLVANRDFFEEENILENYSNYWRENSLQLDYFGNLFLYLENEFEEESLIERGTFNVFVRPYSRYLSLLPEIYQEIDFIARFLKIPELSFDPDVEIWRNQWAYLDPLTAPEAMLPFLAYCFDWKIDRSLPIYLQRRLIRYAMQIYRWRGTRRGLRLFLHLLTDLPLDEDLPEDDKHIRIHETLQKKLIFGQTVLGEDSILGGGQPFYFCVHLNFQGYEQKISDDIMRSVIEQEKPAFCSYDLQIEC